MKKKNNPRFVLFLLPFLLIALLNQNLSHAQTWDELIELGASDAAPADLMGTEVSISGNRAIVSARRNDDAGNRSGSAYIFELIDGVWIETAKLTASDADEEDKFGNSVGISGDYAIVGAAENDDDGEVSGSAYIYEKSGGVWTEMVKLTASDATMFDAFGRSVAISGTTAIVAATGNDDDGSGSGSVYVFDLSGGVWVETVKLTASDAEAGDSFGRSLSISEDQMVIGAPFSDDAGSSSGSAYIFELITGEWMEISKLTASDEAEGEYFGNASSIDGDKVIIGADDNIFGSVEIGAAYIFERIGEEWVEEAKLTASDEGSGDHFGAAVSISGNQAIIGAYGNDEAASSAGAAYIFSLSGGVWSEDIKLTASDATINDQFGVGVGISGSVAIVGAQGHSGGGGPGAAYIFEGCEALDLIATVDDEAICLGDSVIFSAEGADDFTWDLGIMDGVPFEPLTAGTTTYTVTVFIDSTACEYTASVNLVVSDPTVNATVDNSEICLGDSVTFIGTGASTYVWDMDVINAIPFEPTEIGTETYTVIGTNVVGCVDTGSIDVTVYELPEVTATVDESEICFGESVIFNGGGAETYVWDFGVTDGVSFEPLVSGTETYTLIGTDDNGCSSTATVDLTVLEEIIIAFATMDELFGSDGSINITVTGGTPPYTFDWDTDEAGDFDDLEDISDLVGGTYNVVVEDQDGCSANETINLDSQLGVLESKNEGVKLYPNPFNEYTTIYFGEELTEKNYQITIHNILGEELYRLVDINGSSQEIRKENLGVGVYFLSLLTVDSEVVFSTTLFVE